MTGRPNFFDTNVLVAASISDHPHHAASSARLAKLSTTGGACAAHSLAEMYTNLTRFPKGYAVPPRDALRMLQNIYDTFEVVSLTSRENLRAIEATAGQGLTGAIVYDALLMGCARKIDAKWIYTFNVKHFRRVAPDLAPRIVEP